MNSTSTNASEPNKRARPCARQAAGRQHRQPGRDQAPPASAASTSRAPAKQTRPPAKIPNARDFSSPPLIAIHPLLYPPQARRRVLPAQTRTFAGSRAQKLIRCDAFFSFPAGPGEKMEGGGKKYGTRTRAGAREEERTRAGVRSGRVSFSRRHENGQRSVSYGARRMLRDGPAGGGVTLVRRSGTRRGGLFRRAGLLVRTEKIFFGVSNFRRFSVLH